MNYNNLTFLNCACKFTENCSIDEDSSKRREMKELVKYLKSKNDMADLNIFKAMDNVNLNCVLGTKKDKDYKSFLEEYEK